MWNHIWTNKPTTLLHATLPCVCVADMEPHIDLNIGHMTKHPPTLVCVCRRCGTTYGITHQPHGYMPPYHGVCVANVEPHIDLNTGHITTHPQPWCVCIQCETTY